MKKQLHQLMAMAIGCILLAQVSLQAQTVVDTPQPLQNQPVFFADSSKNAQLAGAKAASPQSKADKKKSGKIVAGVIGIGLIGAGVYLGLDATSTELRSEIAGYTYNPITGIRTPNFRMVKETKTDNSKLYGGIGLGLAGVALASYGFSK